MSILWVLLMVKWISLSYREFTVVGLTLLGEVGCCTITVCLEYNPFIRYHDPLNRKDGWDGLEQEILLEESANSYYRH